MKDKALRLKDEDLKEKEKEVRIMSATNQTKQARIQQLRDQLAESHKVS